MLGGFLGFKVHEVDRIEKNYPHIEDRALKMLSIWYNKNPQAATQENMVMALRRLERNDIADEISEILHKEIENDKWGNKTSTST